MKKIIKIAIDSPAAAGAGTQAKLIAKHYKLFYLDTGKIYRFIANLKLNFPNKYCSKYECIELPLLDASFLILFASLWPTLCFHASIAALSSSL